MRRLAFVKKFTQRKDCKGGNATETSASLCANYRHYSFTPEKLFGAFGFIFFRIDAWSDVHQKVYPCRWVTPPKHMLAYG